MQFLADLWLPIVLSAVFVFLASSVVHMVLPMHKSDFRKLPGEAEVMATMRGQGLRPGAYAFPYAQSMKEMGSPEMIARMEEGPVGFVSVLPNGPIRMGAALSQWFAFCLVMSVFCAYVASFARPGDDYLSIFRLTGTVAVVGYGLSNVTDSIWKGVSWTTTGKFLIDGVIYGLVTAGTFGWLWPAA